jgi:hypothetical protein
MAGEALAGQVLEHEAEIQRRWNLRRILSLTWAAEAGLISRVGADILKSKRAQADLRPK